MNAVKDELMVDCLHQNCDCEKRVEKLKHLKQGKFGMCWFVSMLNILFLSDKLTTILRPYLTRTFKTTDTSCTQPDEIAKHLANDVKTKLCTRGDFFGADIRTMLHMEHLAKSKRVFEKVFRDYISKEHTPYRFGSEDFETGGWPYNIIVPYLVYVGFPICNIKHVVMDYDNIASVLKTDPRRLKINRICQDYIRDSVAQYNEYPRILILTRLQNDAHQLHDIAAGRTSSFLGRYVPIILGDKLYVYTLDCAALASNNNSKKHGHAICALTCNTKQYLVNSYDPADATGNLSKSCSTYQYEWTKWKKHDFFHHTITPDDMCKEGTMFDINTLSNDQKTFNFLSTENRFTFHRDVGVNTFVFVVEDDDILPLSPNPQIENIHMNVQTKQLIPFQILTYFTVYIKPYLYLLDMLFKKDGLQPVEYVCEGYELNMQSISTNLTVLQYGSFQPCVNMFIYSIRVPENPEAYARLLIDCLPEDIVICQSKSQPHHFGLLIEYERPLLAEGVICGRYGGSKSTKKAR